jgi:hypothetical protein
MAGLNHDFLLIDEGSFSIDSYGEYEISDRVELHNDLLGYFADSLSWVSTYNPFKDEEEGGLCWYSATIITQESVEKLGSIIGGWLQLISEAPDIVSLKGNWSWVEGEGPETGSYDKLSFSRNEVEAKLKMLIQYCELVKLSGGK